MTIDIQKVNNIKLAQVRRIIGDDVDFAMIALRDCAELVGLVDKSEYCKIIGENKRTVQQKCKDNKIECIEISGIKYPCVNL